MNSSKVIANGELELVGESCRGLF